MLVVTDLKRELRRSTKEGSTSPPISLPTSEAEQPTTTDQNTITAKTRNDTIPHNQEEGLHSQKTSASMSTPDAAGQNTITAKAPATVENGTIPHHQEECLHGQQNPTNMPTTAVVAVDETAKAASNEPVLIGPSPAIVSAVPVTPQNPDGGGPSALFKQHNLRLTSIQTNRQGALEQVLREVGRPVDRKFCPTTFFILSNLAGATGTYYHTEGAYKAQTNGTLHTEKLN